MIVDRIRIIAEAGVNHNGDIRRAMEMVRAAKECGADMVKFQTFTAEKVVSRYAEKAEYQKINTGEAVETQLAMLKKLELKPACHQTLIDECAKQGIEFLSTAFDFDSLDLLNSQGVKTWTVPSGEITNLPFLRKVGSLKGEVILSTGMSDMNEIRATLKILNCAGTRLEKITVLHCSTEYPAPFAELNLRAIQTIRDTFRVNTGYSDHTQGIEAAIAAAALGATIIEKHFTLDKNLPGPDHRASLDPSEFKAMVAAVRNIQTAMGDGKKICAPSEMKNLVIARKSIVAARKILRGERFTGTNLTVKRPGSGLSPMVWDRVIGKTAKRDFDEDEMVEL